MRGWGASLFLVQLYLHSFVGYPRNPLIIDRWASNAVLPCKCPQCMLAPDSLNVS